MTDALNYISEVGFAETAVCHDNLQGGLAGALRFGRLIEARSSVDHANGIQDKLGAEK